MVFNLFITSIICTTIPVDLHLLQLGSSTWKQKQGMQLAWQSWNEPAKQTFLAFEPRWHHHGGRWIWWSGWTPGVRIRFCPWDWPCIVASIWDFGSKGIFKFCDMFWNSNLKIIQNAIWSILSMPYNRDNCFAGSVREGWRHWHEQRAGWVGQGSPFPWRGGLNLHPCSCITFPHIDGGFWKLKTPTRSRGVRHLF